MAAKGLCSNCKQINILDLVPFGPRLAKPINDNRYVMSRFKDAEVSNSDSAAPSLLIATSGHALVSSAQHCKFCDFICSAAMMAISYDVLSDNTIRDAYDAVSLYANANPFDDAAIRIIACEDLLLEPNPSGIRGPTLKIIPWNIMLHTSSNWQHSPEYKLPSVEPLGRAVLDQIKKWTSTCEQSHSTCKPAETSLWSSELDMVRFIDTNPSIDDSVLRLVPAKHIISDTEKSPQYAALTYKWGEYKCHLSTGSNLAHRIRFGFSISVLPAMLRDVVIICRALQIKYLWIDSICIEQSQTDAPTADFAQHVEVMHKIYTHAYFTIAASSCINIERPILKPRHFAQCSIAELPIPFHRFKNPMLLNELFATIEDKRDWLPEAIAKQQLNLDIYRCTLAPTWQNMIDESILERRGWCLQERLMSRRRLCFTSHSLFWECHEFQASEMQPSGIKGNRVLQLGSPLTYLSLSPRTANQNNTALKSSHSIDNAQTIAEMWAKLVIEFSKRKLRVPNDRLHAFRGIASAWALQYTQEGRCLAGLWENNLARELCWHCSCPALQPRTVGIPSWSWASDPMGRVTPGGDRAARDGSYTSEALFRLLNANTVDISRPRYRDSDKICETERDGSLYGHAVCNENQDALSVTKREIQRDKLGTTPIRRLPSGALLVKSRLARMPWPAICFGYEKRYKEYVSAHLNWHPEREPSGHGSGWPSYCYWDIVETELEGIKAKWPYAICLPLVTWYEELGKKGRRGPVQRTTAVVLCPAAGHSDNGDNDDDNEHNSAYGYNVYSRIGLFETDEGQRDFANSSVETYILI